MNDNKASVQLSHLPTGLYILKITGSKVTVTKKIIKQ